jgi:hypothetical protein
VKGLFQEIRQGKKEGSPTFDTTDKFERQEETINKACPLHCQYDGLSPCESAMALDDSEATLLCVDWVSDEDLRHITMFPEVLSIDTSYRTNREKRPLLVFAGTDHNRKNFTAIRAFLPSECEWVFRYVLK